MIRGVGTRIRPIAMLWLALAAGLGLAAGRASAESASYQVGPGDVLQISFYAGGDKQEDFTGTISNTGTITSPLLGEVKVAGLTTYEIERSMTTMLKKEFFKNPQVLVSVKEYGGQVFLMGAVSKPGAYGFQEGLTALRACLLAGGFTQYASLRRVKITRVVDGKSRTMTFDLDKVSKGKIEDPPLVRGDRVEVPRRGF
jgi:protein involved in polysaccharide export with SLBB domain